MIDDDDDDDEDEEDEEDDDDVPLSSHQLWGFHTPKE